MKRLKGYRKNIMKNHNAQYYLELLPLEIRNDIILAHKLSPFFFKETGKFRSFTDFLGNYFKWSLSKKGYDFYARLMDLYTLVVTEFQEQ